MFHGRYKIIKRERERERIGIFQVIEVRCAGNYSENYHTFAGDFPEESRWNSFSPHLHIENEEKKMNIFLTVHFDGTIRFAK